MSIPEIDTRLDPRLLGASTTLEPFAAKCSASRSAMRASFHSQTLVLKGATPRRIITGAEREYGKYTMSVEVPCQAKVLKVVRKYPRQLGIHSFKLNSETSIIYESLEDNTVGSLVIPNFHWNHKVFGFEYRVDNLVKQLSPGSLLNKGQILAGSHSVQKNGDYWYGVELNTAFMEVPGIIEDGLVISESCRDKLRTKGYGMKVVEWGGDCFPLNLYGDDTQYKVFPDIGERIRPDGIIFAMREYDPVLAICNMTQDALQTINHTFDKITYVSLSSVDTDEMPIIEDVSIWHTHNPDLWKTPPGMEKQVRKYWEASKIYHTEIDDVYQSELRRKGKNLKTTNSFHAQLVRGRINDNNIPKMQLAKSVARTFRRAKLDDWRLELRYGWDIKPGIGYKISDSHGAKGVVCAVWPDSHMPCDEYGNVADIITGGPASIRRMTMGRFDEQYINACSVYIEKQCKQMIVNNDLIGAKNLLVQYYSIIAPMMYDELLKYCPTEQQQIEHTIEQINEGIQLWIPQNSPDMDMRIQQLRQTFPVPVSPVTYVDDSGIRVKTVKPILIGSVYYMLLEKIGDDWGATSIPKRQHHGIPGKLTDTDKSSLPWRDQAFKTFGESEVRLLLGTCDPDFVASLINFPNNPAMCMDVAQRILTVDKPTDLHMVVDYKKYAEMPGRANQYFNHILATSGVKITKGEPVNG